MWLLCGFFCIIFRKSSFKISVFFVKESDLDPLLSFVLHLACARGLSWTERGSPTYLWTQVGHCKETASTSVRDISCNGWHSTKWIHEKIHHQNHPRTYLIPRPDALLRSHTRCFFLEGHYLDYLELILVQLFYSVRVFVASCWKRTARTKQNVDP